MLTDAPRLLDASSLSVLWAKAFLHSMGPCKPAPMLLTMEGFEENIPAENPGFRALVDKELAALGNVRIRDNAYTIFPDSLWERHGRSDRQELYRRYGQLLPRLMFKRKNKKGSPHGTYFGRMIGWAGSRSKMKKCRNQLEDVISIWPRKGGRTSRPRISAMQIGCFSPKHDLPSQLRPGFPCLHQVAFSYENDGLVITAMYPSQYVFDRGYGNYLGLCDLGRFMAEQLGLNLVRLNCLVTAPSRGEVSKKRLESLRQAACDLIAKHSSQSANLCTDSASGA